MSSDTATPDSLLHRFQNADDVFADQIVAKPTGDVFHRLDLKHQHPRPACRASSDARDWERSSPEAVQQAGLQPCRACYKAIFEYLAADPTSPVEARDVLLDTNATESEGVDDFEPVGSTSQPPPLTALTDEVMVTGGSKIMHAPTPKGPLCIQPGEYRRVDRSVVEGHYRPCRDCFSLPPDTYS